MAKSMAFIIFITKPRRIFMELFTKKFFHSLFVLTILICLGTVKVEGMEHQQSINHFEPLYNLCRECISEASIKKACNDSFGRICAMVVHDKNPSESIRWLKKQPRIEIDTLFLILKEQVNREWAPHIMYSPMPNPTSNGVSMSTYFSYVFRTLESEEYMLYKKIAVLISILDEALASSVTVADTSVTGNAQRPAYLNLDNAKLLQDAVESIVMWLPWQEWKDSWKKSWRDIQALWEKRHALWENMHALWRKTADTCELL